MIRVRNPQDFWAGVLFMVAAAIALWRGWSIARHHHADGSGLRAGAC